MNAVLSIEEEQSTNGDILGCLEVFHWRFVGKFVECNLV